MYLLVSCSASERRINSLVVKSPSGSGIVVVTLLSRPELNLSNENSPSYMESADEEGPLGRRLDPLLFTNGPKISSYANSQARSPSISATVRRFGCGIDGLKRGMFFIASSNRWGGFFRALLVLDEDSADMMVRSYDC